MSNSIFATLEKVHLFLIHILPLPNSWGSERFYTAQLE